MTRNTTAVTNASALAYLSIEQIENNNTPLIPTGYQIQTLISSNEFVNTEITTAFKNLLIQISLESGYLFLPSLINKISQMFHRIGFYRDNGSIHFQANIEALDVGTDMIINNLNNFTDFQEVAYNAFHNNTWAKGANDIRAMANSGLQKLHYITVYSNSNSNTNFNNIDNINSGTNILNRRGKNTDRFLMINLDQNADPVMPTVRIKNNSDVNIKLRVKIEHENYVATAETSNGAFGPAIPYDVNNDGTIQSNENIYLNRRFTDYFPNQANAQEIEEAIFTVVMPPQQVWDVDFDNRIRGGTATVEFIPYSQNVNSWAEGDHHYFQFHIRGKNPTYQQVRNYLNAQNYLNRFWFLIRKIRHESGSFGSFDSADDNFNRNPQHDNYEFQHFNRRFNSQTYNLRKFMRRTRDTYGVPGLPAFGPPRGFGLGQIDNFGEASPIQVPNPPPIGDTISVIIDEEAITVDYNRTIVASDQEVWHWKRNIDAGIRVLEMKIRELRNRRDNPNLSLRDLRDQINNWNNANPTNRVVSPGNQVEPPANEATQGNRITFSFIETDIEGLTDYNTIFNGATSTNQYEKSFLDACLLKAYNGYGAAPHRNYLYFTLGEGGKPKLHISRPSNNYVAEVCRKND